MKLRLYDRADASEVLRLWNTAGVAAGYAPLDADKLDALLLAPVNAPAGSTAYLSAADDAGVPLLFVTSIYADLARPCVMCDLYGGMRMMLPKSSKMTLISTPAAALRRKISVRRSQICPSAMI